MSKPGGRVPYEGPGAFIDLADLLTTVRLVVPTKADAKVSWVVHEHLLTHTSRFAKAALSGTWKESEDRVIELSDKEPEVVGLFIRYLYTKSVVCLGNDAKVKLYVLADELEAPALKSALLPAAMSAFPGLSPSQFLYVLDNTSAPDALREYCLQQLADSISKSRLPLSDPVVAELSSRHGSEILQMMLAMQQFSALEASHPFGNPKISTADSKTPKVPVGLAKNSTSSNIADNSKSQNLVSTPSPSDSGPRMMSLFVEPLGKDDESAYTGLPASRGRKIVPETASDSQVLFAGLSIDEDSQPGVTSSPASAPTGGTLNVPSAFGRPSFGFRGSPVGSGSVPAAFGRATSDCGSASPSVEASSPGFGGFSTGASGSSSSASGQGVFGSPPSSTNDINTRPSSGSSPSGFYFGRNPR